MSHIKQIHNGSLERFLDLLLIAFIVFMTLKGGTSGACAACKYQRRRCAADCPLAPYFPAEQPKLFQNVHRLFGVRSIVKILENLEEAQKPEAMKSIIFQSYVRDRSPVHGCLGVTQHLQYMVCVAEEELKAVNSQLQFYRSQQQQNGQTQTQMMMHEIGDDNNKQQEDVTSQQLDLGMGLTVNNNNHHHQNNGVTPFFSPLLPVSETQQPQMSYTYSCSEVNNNGFSPPAAYNADSCKEILNDNTNDAWGGLNRFHYDNDNGFGNQNEINKSNNNNNGVMAIQSQLVNLQMASNHHQQQQEEEDDDNDYDEIHQFLEIIEDRQSYADSKEAYASSSGENLKEQIDEIGENELRSAATCFSLTSVN